MISITCHGCGQTFDADISTSQLVTTCPHCHRTVELAPNRTFGSGVAIAALVVGLMQFVFVYNLIASYFRGKAAGSNPWDATTLEWQTPKTPPSHGNWGDTLPTVHRWAYDYSVPGEEQDFVPQNVERKP